MVFPITTPKEKKRKEKKRKILNDKSLKNPTCTYLIGQIKKSND
jgi:hypothetical protein